MGGTRGRCCPGRSQGTCWCRRSKAMVRRAFAMVVTAVWSGEERAQLERAANSAMLEESGP